jgi:hypothetical protein
MAEFSRKERVLNNLGIVGVCESEQTQQICNDSQVPLFNLVLSFRPRNGGLLNLNVTDNGFIGKGFGRGYFELKISTIKDSNFPVNNLIFRTRNGIEFSPDSKFNLRFPTYEYDGIYRTDIGKNALNLIRVSKDGFFYLYQCGIIIQDNGNCYFTFQEMHYGNCFFQQGNLRLPVLEKAKKFTLINALEERIKDNRNRFSIPNWIPDYILPRPTYNLRELLPNQGWVAKFFFASMWGVIITCDKARVKISSTHIQLPDNPQIIEPQSKVSYEKLIPLGERSSVRDWGITHQATNVMHID